MRNMDLHRLRPKFAVALGLMTSLTLQAAAECPRQDALGTSRIIAVNAAATPRVSAKTLQLGDREVVLTFDDGPSPPTDGQILADLAGQCVRATFFLIGRPASEHPELVRQIAAAGHSVGHHTWSHQNLKVMKPEDAAEEIDKGAARFSALSA